MKITNTFVGYFLWSLMGIPFVMYLSGNLWSDDNIVDNFFKLSLISGSAISLLVEVGVGIVEIFENKFEFTLDLSFGIKKYFDRKRKSIEMKDEFYSELFKAKTAEEIDLINKKIDLLK